MKATISFGEGAGGAWVSVKRFWMGVVEPGFLAREKVCLSEAKLPGFGESKAVGGGEGERLREPSAAVLLFEGDGTGVPFGFFLLVPKERKKDHSDSNCTDSKSDDNGEYSSKQPSSISSIRLSAKRMMKTLCACVSIRLIRRCEHSPKTEFKISSINVYESRSSQVSRIASSHFMRCSHTVRL